MPGTDKAWRLDGSGTLAQARQVPSPNRDGRPAGAAITLLVIHNISLPPGEFGGSAVEELFTNCLNPRAHPYFAGIADLKVSSHFLIRRDGGLIQFVPCQQRAWHAGQSQWQGREHCNDYSIGIELEGDDHSAYADGQYDVLARLGRALLRTYPISDVVGHSDIALPAGRKTDPGPAFEWTRFRKALHTR
ncbi:MAG: 1,6-anhydro-N-acetylmuramyl-L-alanine amidase AmpD [Burkholderiales bacterium]